MGGLSLAPSLSRRTHLSHSLSLLQSWSVPQRWFLHFYVLGVATTTAVLLEYGSLVLEMEEGGGGSSWWRRHLAPSTTTPPLIAPARARALAALAALWLHLARRLGECALLTRWPAGARMHGLAYLFSIR